MTKEPVSVRALLDDRILVTRESARELASALDAPPSEGTIELDLEGFGGMTPSFFDELVGLCEEVAEETDGETTRIVLHNPPTNASSKFQAVARSHRRTLTTDEQERWILTSQTTTAAR